MGLKMSISLGGRTWVTMGAVGWLSDPWGQEMQPKLAGRDRRMR